jgi:hypothetical protein
LFQGLVFQGFILEVASIIEDEISLELREHFMDSRLVSELKKLNIN